MDRDENPLLPDAFDESGEAMTAIPGFFHSA